MLPKRLFYPLTKTTIPVEKYKEEIINFLDKWIEEIKIKKWNNKVWSIRDKIFFLSDLEIIIKVLNNNYHKLDKTSFFQPKTILTKSAALTALGMIVILIVPCIIFIAFIGLMITTLFGIDPFLGFVCISIGSSFPIIYLFKYFYHTAIALVKGTFTYTTDLRKWICENRAFNEGTSEEIKMRVAFVCRYLEAFRKGARKEMDETSQLNFRLKKINCAEKKSGSLYDKNSDHCFIPIF